MRIIVTGATSFVGLAVVRELLEAGHTVAAVLRPDSKKTDLITAGNEQAANEGRLLIVENDLSTPKDLKGKLEGTFDAFCHFAWGGSGSDARNNRPLQEANLKASLSAVHGARALGCRRFLFSGSQAEYGLHHTLMTEETPCSPRSAYGEAKLSMAVQGSALCGTLGMEYVHLRIFSAYGPGDHPWTLTETCIDTFLADEEMRLGECTQQWNYIHIKDLAGAIRILTETKHLPKEAGTIYNLATEDTRPLRAFVEAIHKECAKKGTLCYNVRPANAEGQINLIPDITRLKNLGWRQEISFEEGIRAMVAARKSADEEEK